MGGGVDSLLGKVSWSAAGEEGSQRMVPGASFKALPWMKSGGGHPYDTP